MIRCVKCGKIMKWSEAKGSLKHPYCSGCFKEVWDDDYKKYFDWLGKTHF